MSALAGQPDHFIDWMEKSGDALGPLRRATLWETTAIPDIREQALELAERIVSQLSENGVAKSMAAVKI
jgi:uncharacterized NAD(P)/FAD-binding protein YdhS